MLVDFRLPGGLLLLPVYSITRGQKAEKWAFLSLRPSETRVRPVRWCDRVAKTGAFPHFFPQLWKTSGIALRQPSIAMIEEAGSPDHEEADLACGERVGEATVA